MVTTFCDEDSVKLMAGANVSSSLTTANYTELINQAESRIIDQIRVDLIASYASLDDKTKKLLEQAAACWAAMDAITYDLISYTSLAEAQTLLDKNYTKFKEAMDLLERKEITKFIEDI